ncbi:glycosyltransferase, partial [Patescibacteria group bacterium]|nr:glycosyltransferase [Patescibacteria group bacterium]MBU1449101.1 glycosyltransferase [Patescibacteria group bacterium]
FSYDQEGGRLMRERWGVDQGQALLGLSGRLDPMKDHANFLKAARIIRAARSDARFVCIGGGDPSYLAGLEKQAESLGLSEAVVWAGEISDMPAAYSALDIAVSASSGESFSNVVAEAMACQRPVAVTEVGDSARIVGPVGKVAPAGDAAALAGACQELLSLNETERQDIGAALKQRVEQKYSVEAMLTASEEYLTNLLLTER